jgi:tRNA-dihydrouridine synthase
MNRVLDEHLSSQQAFLNTLKNKYGTPRDDAAVEENVAAEFRCHLFRYLHGLNGSSHIRGRMHELQTLPAIRAAIKTCFEREAAHRASAPSRVEH